MCNSGIPLHNHSNNNNYLLNYIVIASIFPLFTFTMASSWLQNISFFRSFIEYSKVKTKIASQVVAR